MDSAAGDAAYINGQEFVNAARTIAYIEAGYGPPGLTVDGGCNCPNIRELAGCDTTPYTVPKGTIPAPTPGATNLDAAPWYDASVPESADFAGFYPTKFEGLGSTYTRQRFPKVGGGSVLGKQVAQDRVLTWTGYLFGRTCCATQFGLRWLTQQLAGISCGCDGEDLDVLYCCPSVTGGFTGCKGLPSIQFGIECGQVAASPFSAFRTLKQAALLEGPTVLSERKSGCGNGSETGCAAESCITEVTFSMVAANPYLHGCPQPVCTKMKWAATPTTCPAGTLKTFGVGDPVTFKKATTGTACNNPNCSSPLDCGSDPNCPYPTLPTLSGSAAVCGACDALDPVTACCTITDDQFGEFFDGVPVIEIYSGQKAMKNIKIKFFNNPLHLLCKDIDKDDCNKCDSVQIRYIPAESNLIIDGLSQQIILKCPGNEAGSRAEQLSVTPFSWSTVQCMNVCICVEADGMGVDGKGFDIANAYVNITAVPRQM